MLIFDTNVISELMRPAPDPTVLGWARSVPSTMSYTTTVSEAEIRYGLALLSDGARKRRLESEVDGIFAEDFEGRVLAFGREAAMHFGLLCAARQRSGRPLAIADAMIAGIASAYGSSIATRNVADFENLGIDVHDPWAS
ncbi:MAG: type II toxin-antitoxin system VapC family toxin [Pseudomonadota bacterium]